MLLQLQSPMKKKKMLTVMETEKNKLELNENMFENKSGGFSLRFYEYLTYFFCPCGKTRQKKETVTKAIAKIEERVDPVYILNKMLEIDKLKMVLLKPNQLRLFDFLPKPILNFDKCENEIS